MELLDGGGFILDKPEEISAYRLLALKGALRLECRGMHASHGSAEQTVRDILKKDGRKGERTRSRLLQQYEDWLKEKGYSR